MNLTALQSSPASQWRRVMDGDPSCLWDAGREGERVSVQRDRGAAGSGRPSTVTPVVTVIEVRARTFPRRMEQVPSAAELPTLQKILDDRAPLTRTTLLPDAVM